MHPARGNQPSISGTQLCLPQRRLIQRPAAGAITDEPWSAVNSGNSEQRSQNVKQTLNTFDAIHTGNPASVFSSSIPRSSSVSSAKSSLSPSSATRSSRTDSSATNGSQSKRRCCNNRNKQSQLEAEEEYSESQDYCIYRCPVWQKARGPGKSKLPSICQTIEGTKDVIEQHSEDHHLGCPICRMDPKLQRKRSHAKDGVLTVPMTMDKMYFGEMPNFIDHIKRHLKFYFCVNCGQGCFTQQSQNEHENNCREKISGVDLSKNRQVDEAVRKMILEVDKWRAANTNSDKSFKKGKDVIGDLSKVLLFDPVYSKNGKEKRVKKFDSLDNTNNFEFPSLESDTSEYTSSDQGKSTESSLSSCPLEQWVDNINANLPYEDKTKRYNILCRLISHMNDGGRDMIRHILGKTQDGKASGTFGNNPARNLSSLFQSPSVSPGLVTSHDVPRNEGTEIVWGQSVLEDEFSSLFPPYNDTSLDLAPDDSVFSVTSGGSSLIH